jgi:hypothetical protein
MLKRGPTHSALELIIKVSPAQTPDVVLLIATPKAVIPKFVILRVLV